PLVAPQDVITLSGGSLLTSATALPLLQFIATPVTAGGNLVNDFSSVLALNGPLLRASDGATLTLTKPMLAATGASIVGGSGQAFVQITGATLTAPKLLDLAGTAFNLGASPLAVVSGNGIIP